MRFPLLALAALVASAAAGGQVVRTTDYTFDYSYPAAARAIPALRAWLEADRRAARAAVASDAAQARRESRDGSFPFRPYDAQTAWKVVTSTPRFLSLSGESYSYTGGAHGGTVSRALLWDRLAGKRLSPDDVFISAAAVQRAIGGAFCDRLDAQRSERRGERVVRGRGMFDNCPRVAEGTLILGSTTGRAIDRVGVLVDQYVAGPYAEGRYDVTLPVTPALLAAVKPAYRSAFAPGR